jgi:hypothetical protein
MPENEKVKVIKRQEQKRHLRDSYIRRHKISLLELLIEENPERAEQLLRKLRQSNELRTA